MKRVTHMKNSVIINIDIHRNIINAKLYLRENFTYESWEKTYDTFPVGNA